jgi:hypothetical protein
MPFAGLGAFEGWRHERMKCSDWMCFGVLQDEMHTMRLYNNRVLC